MTAPLTQHEFDALLANLDCNRERAGERYEQIRERLVRLFEWRGCGASAEDLADETMNRVAKRATSGLGHLSNPYATLCGAALQIYKEVARQFAPEQTALEAREQPPTTAHEEPNPVSSAALSAQPVQRQTPLLEHLRHLFQTHCPLLYTQVLEPTLADLREEHSAAFAEGHPLKARCVLLQGCGALAAAAVCQLGYSLLGRIAALWKARSPK